VEKDKPISIASLIAIPAVITLAVTILRLEGELHRWSKLWFDWEAGGGAAIVGISWLPIVFGPYFALKLAGAGDVPAKMGRAIGFAVLGLVVLFLGMVLLFATFSHPSILTLMAFPVMLIAAVIPRIGWRSFGNALIAYAFAARIPVLIVMYLAMRGSWNTHYDAVAQTFQNAPLGKKFFNEAFLPQMFGWIGYTVVLGSLAGVIITAVRSSRRRTQAEAKAVGG
jgi:hypothetical protein